MPTIEGQKFTWDLHHYTDLNALVSILGKDRIILRATNILYLNDSRELKEGIEVVKKVENKDIHIGSFRNYYITAFSSCEDNLNMWGMYAANGSGCALSFDFDKLSHCYPVMAKCVYGEEKAKNDLSGFLNLSRKGSVVNLGGPQMTKEQEIQHKKEAAENTIITTCLTAKNKAYEHEQEMRGIVYCENGIPVKFRVRNNYIVPYVEIALPKDALTKITVGPTNNSDLTMMSIMHLLKINDYPLDATKVVSSKIPYRG